MTYDDYYWHARNFLLMPQTYAHAWALEQVAADKKVDHD